MNNVISLEDYREKRQQKERDRIANKARFLSTSSEDIKHYEDYQKVINFLFEQAKERSVEQQQNTKNFTFKALYKKRVLTQKLEDTIANVSIAVNQDGVIEVRLGPEMTKQQEADMVDLVPGLLSFNFHPYPVIDVFNVTNLRYSSKVLTLDRNMLVLETSFLDNDTVLSVRQLTFVKDKLGHIQALKYIKTNTSKRKSTLWLLQQDLEAETYALLNFQD